MKPQLRFGRGLIAAFAFAATVIADPRVIVTSRAAPEYTQAKFKDGKARRETYIVIQGRFHGGITADPSIERMPFRQIVSYLYPQLNDQNFVPAKSVDEADLMLVVHWGVTNPRASTREFMARSDYFSPSQAMVADSTADSREQENVEALNSLQGAEDRYGNMELLDELVTNEQSDRELAQLLGYTDTLRKFNRSPITRTEEETLRFDLRTERYFIIVRAYPTKVEKRLGRPQPLWTLNLNMSSPGSNFPSAMARMSAVAPSYMGRTTDGVETVRTKAGKARVELGELIIIGEASDPTDRP